MYCVVDVPGCATDSGLGVLCSDKRGGPLARAGRGTYIGYTVDLFSRLREHNGKVKGGAKRTSASKGNWVLAWYVSGFPASHNYSAAMSFEYAVKHAKVGDADKATAKAATSAAMAHQNLGKRIKQVDAVLRRESWTGSCVVKAADVPLVLHWAWPLAPCPIPEDSLPATVSLATEDHAEP